MLRVLLPHFDSVVFTRSGNPRSLSPATLMSLAEKLGPAVPTEAAANPRAALDRGRVLAGPAGAVIATDRSTDRRPTARGAGRARVVAVGGRRTTRAEGARDG